MHYVVCCAFFDGKKVGQFNLIILYVADAFRILCNFSNITYFLYHKQLNVPRR